MSLELTIAELNKNKLEGDLERAAIIQAILNARGIDVSDSRGPAETDLLRVAVQPADLRISVGDLEAVYAKYRGGERLELGRMHFLGAVSELVVVVNRRNLGGYIKLHPDLKIGYQPHDRKYRTGNAGLLYHLGKRVFNGREREHADGFLIEGPSGTKFQIQRNVPFNLAGFSSGIAVGTNVELQQHTFNQRPGRPPNNRFEDVATSQEGFNLAMADFCCVLMSSVNGTYGLAEKEGFE